MMEGRLASGIALMHVSPAREEQLCERLLRRYYIKARSRRC
jgi:hypothetical protein